MFTEKQLDNYAEALLWGICKQRKSDFKEGDVVMIKSRTPGMPLVEVLYRKVLQRGWQPVVRILGTDTMEVDYFTYAKDHHLDWLPPWWKEEAQEVRGNIYIIAPTSLTHLKDVSPEKQQRGAKAVKPWRDFITEQEQKDLFAWTLALWPSECCAEKAGISLEDFTEQIIKACHLNSDNIWATWDSIQNEIDNIKASLDLIMPDINYFHMVSDSGSVDLKITPGDMRKWLGGRGCNIPSFEIFTSPDWRGTNGKFYADQPSYRSGRLVKGVKLEFKDGLVINASAEEGEDYLISTLDTDDDSRKVGEFSLTDIRHSKIDRFMADTLFDENFGGKNGNSHIAIGSAYLETYTGDQVDLDKNRKTELGYSDSVVHWDLVNTENKTVKAVMKDETTITIYENGMFVK